MWVVCRLSVFCEPFTDRAFGFVGFPYILFFTFFTFDHICKVSRLELQFICCFICLVSPVLLKVYEVLALSM